MWHIDDLRGQLGGSKWVRFTISFLCPGGSFYELKPRLTRGEGGRRVAGKEKFLQNEDQKSESEWGAEIWIRIRMRSRRRKGRRDFYEKTASEMHVAPRIFSATFLCFHPFYSFYPFSSIFIHFGPFYPLPSTFIHFGPRSSIFIHFHPFSSIFINFHPLSSIVSTFIQFHPF